MAELVEGVGDEVLLFSAFFLLSLIMLVVLSWRRRGRRGRAEGERGGGEQEREGGHTSQQQPPAAEEGVQTVPTPAEQGGRDHVRSRFGGSGHDEPAQGTEMSVRLVLPQGTRSVGVRADTSLESIQRAHFQEELAQSRPVLFILRGQPLQDVTQTLQQLGIADNTALHVHVGQPQVPRPPQEVGPDQVDFDLSRLFLPLLGLVLGVVWVLLLSFPHVFSTLTKLLLFALSLGYVFLAYSSTRA